jgi:DNA-binding transcriptional LysR family regulator
VSQQIATLSREAGTVLVEPVGRRVRLTPAGRRLADHAVTILAAMEAARVDLDRSAAPQGTVRVAAYATAVRLLLLPAVGRLAQTHPDLHLQIHEHEPDECLVLLAADDVDLALTYDYNLAPATFDRSLITSPLGEYAWSLAVPAEEAHHVSGPALAVFDRFRSADWIVNSRNTADADVVRTVASLAGFQPRITHRADSLELLQDMIVAGLGVGLLPTGQQTVEGVSLLPLRDPGVVLRAYSVARRGRTEWPPLAVVLAQLADGSAPRC